ncbi:hypothetical protein L915_19920 [Phytophthora nicotianae]|uniref:Uncharacterized protein n=1 Tax=Phytophthora nicotianae TaxID=4792 RepID=W2HXG9_PHYNI|nr:hypothetical protein L915_19920 [Phytophthora nicotianae]ETL26551.1 hypothetical protein L916_19801 [Phytophthora nicotianae]
MQQLDHELHETTNQAKAHDDTQSPNVELPVEPQIAESAHLELCWR